MLRNLFAYLCSNRVFGRRKLDELGNAALLYRGVWHVVLKPFELTA